MIGSLVMHTVDGAPLPVIQLSAATWREPIHFIAALKLTLGAIEGCGSSVDAMIDVMVYGGMSRIEAPYVIRISDVGAAPQEVQNFIALTSEAIAEARAWKKDHYGVDVEVGIEIST